MITKNTNNKDEDAVYMALHLCFPHLKTEQIVNSADNDVDCGCVSSLGSQEVLEI